MAQYEVIIIGFDITSGIHFFNRGSWNDNISMYYKAFNAVEIYLDRY
ncbi:hypothetical protein BN440_2617 [Erwinia amylovora MR1]|nr:hypothetical protein BN440_2617 [Erwinia amylovora MR1]